MAILIVCVLLSQPYAETGMHDDWSYIRSAQVLAATGHFAYNGWASATLGWQLLPGALFIKLFGFSFTAVRFSTLVFAAVPTTFLLQRAMVRCGIGEGNAAIGTLTLMLSPLTFPVTTSFLSDAWGLSAIVLCLYCCLRALQGRTDGVTIAWICTAALSNALIGTARQIAWLGVMLMVPCTLWLLRHRQAVLRAGIAACLAGYAIIYGMLRWFAAQPYTLSYGLNLRRLPHSLREPLWYIRPALEIPLLLLPVLLMFLPALWRSRPRIRLWIAVAGLVLAGLVIEGHMAHWLHDCIAPFTVEHGCIFSKNGWYVMWPVRGDLPEVLSDPVRIVLSLATLAGIAAVSAALTLRPKEVAEPGESKLPWKTLAVLTLPFSLGYAFLLLPSLTTDLLIDRYLISLIVVAMLFLLRLYQERIQGRLPAASAVLAGVIAVYMIAATHDGFALYRAVATAANEVTSAGVARQNFDGGWEYNGTTQIDVGRYVHEPGVHQPDGVDYKPGHERVCELVAPFYFPQVVPDYSLSFNPNDCGGPSRFAPVTIHRWLAPHQLVVYVVTDPPLPAAGVPATH